MFDFCWLLIYTWNWQLIACRRKGGLYIRGLFSKLTIQKLHLRNKCPDDAQSLLLEYIQLGLFETIFDTCVECPFHLEIAPSCIDHFYQPFHKKLEVIITSRGIETYQRNKFSQQLQLLLDWSSMHHASAVWLIYLAIGRKMFCIYCDHWIWIGSLWTSWELKKINLNTEGFASFNHSKSVLRGIEITFDR